VILHVDPVGSFLPRTLLGRRTVTTATRIEKERVSMPRVKDHLATNAALVMVNVCNFSAFHRLPHLFASYFVHICLQVLPVVSNIALQVTALSAGALKVPFAAYGCSGVT
jgi:hypothetical protein